MWYDAREGKKMNIPINNIEKKINSKNTQISSGVLSISDIFNFHLH